MYTLVLGERLNGIQEVSGSIPLISTTKKGQSSARMAVLFSAGTGRRPPASCISIVGGPPTG